MQDWNTTLTLGLWNCRGLRADEDIVGMLGILRELGLESASGMYGDGRPSEPAGDLAAFVAARLRDSRQGTLSEGKDLPYFRLEPRRGMSFALLHPSMPGLRGGGSVQLSHPVIWDVVIHAYVGSYDSGSDPREADSAFMGELLERIGDSLYELARPAIAYLVAEAFDEDTGVDPQHPDRRRLIVGWRTWFGPAYVDHWGREWLLQLPDGATELDDGGVKHSLEASAFEVVRGGCGRVRAGLALPPPLGSAACLPARALAILARPYPG
jgi:hypothetical protein